MQPDCVKLRTVCWKVPRVRFYYESGGARKKSWVKRLQWRTMAGILVCFRERECFPGVFWDREIVDFCDISCAQSARVRSLKFLEFSDF
jgi:hypothetical protein